jgi:hypothetical protein
MRRAAAVGIALATHLGWAGAGTAQERPKISREAVTAMFKAARTNPRTKWSIDGKCLWGYFFVDPDPQRLERALQQLQRDGYRYVGIRGPSQGRTGPQFTLHVEKVERHSVDTLLATNNRLYALARKHGLQSYDGMDVGPLPGGKCE